MADLRYGDLRVVPGSVSVTGIGTQPGPNGGDAWQIVGRLPTSAIPGAGRYAFIVSGKMGGFGISGTGAANVLAQVCLGDAGGFKHPLYKQNVPLRENLPNFEALPFQFLLLFCASPVITDPAYGATWANTADLVLWARIYRNGDPATFSGQFTVSDVTFLWWDMTRIPSTDQLAEQYSPASPGTNAIASFTNHFQTINVPGHTGEKWLHVMNAWYEPRGMPGAAAPLFQFGYATAVGFGTFAPKLGSGQRWGQARSLPLTLPEAPTLQQGGWWYQVQPGSVFLPSCRGLDRQPVAASGTLVRRIRYVGIRLDQLPDVLARTDAFVDAATGRLLGPVPWQNVYVPLERLQQGTTSLPMVMSHGIVEVLDARRAHGGAMTTDVGRQLSFFGQAEQVDGPTSEGCSVMTASLQGFSPLLADLQYRDHFVGGISAPPNPLRVSDLSIVSFYPIKDPSIIPAVPAVPGAPVVIVPATQCADVSVLPDPPQAPDGRVSEDSSRPDADVVGDTGYRRSWPMAGRSVRTFSLQWTCSTSQETTLRAFLDGTIAFRILPPAAIAKIAVLRVENARTDPLGGGAFIVSVRVAEVSWSG